MDAEKLQKIVNNACRMAHKGLVAASPPSTAGVHPTHFAVATVAAALIAGALDGVWKEALNDPEDFD